jgi:hypothetical protein
MNKEEENSFITLLQGMLEVGESAKGITVGNDDRILDAEGLFFKFFSHCCTAFYLRRKTIIGEIKNINVNFLDVPSILIITRAAIESYIVFNYVYLQPTNSDEANFRYWAWEYTGTFQRQRIMAVLPESKEKLKHEKKVLDKIRDALSETGTFKSLTTKQQNNLVNGGNWTIPVSTGDQNYYPSWSKLAKLAGLNDKMAFEYYGFLSEYAHSTSWSIMQLRDPNFVHVRDGFIDTALKSLMSIMALMIKAYIKFFNLDMDIVKKNSDLNRAIEVWSFVSTH